MGNRTKLDGIFIPVITPFNKDESINYAGIKEIAAFLSKNGVTGIIPAGSTGEMIALDKEEQMAVNRAYIDAGHQERCIYEKEIIECFFVFSNNISVYSRMRRK